MGFFKFAGLLLGFIILWHALDYSSVHAHAGGESKVVLITGKGQEKIAILSQDKPKLKGAIFTSAAKKGPGGRKMAPGEGLRGKLDTEKEQRLMKKNPSKCSAGNHQISTQKSSRDLQMDQTNIQKRGAVSLERTSKSEGVTVPDNVSFHNSFQSKAAFAETENPNVVSPKTSSPDMEGFVDAAEEVAHLMQKDYSAKGKARRRSPINNHKPTD